MGLEGIVSKRIEAPCCSGLCKTRLKSKTPPSEAVRREQKEDWGLIYVTRAWQRAVPERPLPGRPSAHHHHEGVDRTWWRKLASNYSYRHELGATSRGGIYAPTSRHAPCR